MQRKTIRRPYTGQQDAAMPKETGGAPKRHLCDAKRRELTCRLTYGDLRHDEV